MQLRFVFVIIYISSYRSVIYLYHLSLWSIMYLFSRSPRQNLQCYTNPKSLLLVYSTQAQILSLTREPRLFFPMSTSWTRNILCLLCRGRKQSPKREFDLTNNMISQLVMPICSVAGTVVSDSVRPQRQQPTRLSVPGILQARTLEWVAISSSKAWKWKVKVKSLSRVWL